MEKILVLAPLHSTAIAKALLRPGQRLTIGRTANSDYPVPFDNYMYSLHVELNNTLSKFWIYDLKSRSGTFLNDLKIQTACLLQGSGIAIRIRSASSIQARHTVCVETISLASPARSIKAQRTHRHATKGGN